MNIEINHLSYSSYTSIWSNDRPHRYLTTLSSRIYQSISSKPHLYDYLSRNYHSTISILINLGHHPTSIPSLSRICSSILSWGIMIHRLLDLTIHNLLWTICAVSLVLIFRNVRIGRIVLRCCRIQYRYSLWTHKSSIHIQYQILCLMFTFFCLIRHRLSNLSTKGYLFLYPQGNKSLDIHWYARPCN